MRRMKKLDPVHWRKRQYLNTANFRVLLSENINTLTTLNPPTVSYMTEYSGLQQQQIESKKKKRNAVKLLFFFFLLFKCVGVLPLLDILLLPVLSTCI